MKCCRVGCENEAVPNCPLNCCEADKLELEEYYDEQYRLLQEERYADWLSMQR